MVQRKSEMPRVIHACMSNHICLPYCCGKGVAESVWLLLIAALAVWASGSGFYSPLSFYWAVSASSAADNLERKFISTIKQEKYDFIAGLNQTVEYWGFLLKVRKEEERYMAC